MLFIYVNSKNKSVKHLVLAEDSFVAKRIMLRYYDKHNIEGEPLRVKPVNDDVVTFIEK